MKSRPHPVEGVLGYVYDGDEIDEYFDALDQKLREILDLLPEFVYKDSEAHRCKKIIRDILGDSEASSS